MYKYKNKKYYRDDDLLVDYYTDALKGNPSSPLFLPLADIYLKNNRFSLAFQTCQTGLEKMPRYHSARFLLGQIYHAMDEEKKAVSELEKVIKAKPDNIGATSLLAEIFMVRGDVERSRELYTQLLALNPKDKKALKALSHLPTTDTLKHQGELAHREPGKHLTATPSDLQEVIKTGEQVMQGKKVLPMPQIDTHDEEYLMPTGNNKEEFLQQLEDIKQTEKTFSEETIKPEATSPSTAATSKTTSDSDKAALKTATGKEYVEESSDKPSVSEPAPKEQDADIIREEDLVSPRSNKTPEEVAILPSEEEGNEQAELVLSENDLEDISSEELIESIEISEPQKQTVDLPEEVYAEVVLSNEEIDGTEEEYLVESIEVVSLEENQNPADEEIAVMELSEADKKEGKPAQSTFHETLDLKTTTHEEITIADEILDDLNEEYLIDQAEFQEGDDLVLDIPETSSQRADEEEIIEVSETDSTSKREERNESKKVFTASLLDDKRPLDAIGQLFQKEESEEDSSEKADPKNQLVINKLQGMLNKL